MTAEGAPDPRVKKLLLLVEVRARKNWRPGWDEGLGGPVLVWHISDDCPDDCVGAESVAAFGHDTVVCAIRDHLDGLYDEAFRVHSVRQAVAP